MDISVIDATKVTSENGIKIGSDDAQKKMIEFINLRCPFCKKWFEESYELLEEAVAEGKVQRIIKLFDKEKESLQRGNVMQHHISYDQPDLAIKEIKTAFDSQDDWAELTLEEVAAYAEKELGFKDQTNEMMIQGIIQEAEAANIKFVPTVVVNEHIFDENITQDELKEILGM